MKNLKSILKKLTLILLASFLLAGSPNLLAMDPDTTSSIVAGSESEVALAGCGAEEHDESEEEKIKFVLQDGTEIFLPETVDPNISGYISSLVILYGSKYPEIKINEESPENIRRVCNETIIKKFINYLEKVSENTSMLMLRSNLEDETPDDFKALAVLANYFDVNSLMHACAPRCVETLTSLDNLNKFKQDPTMTELFKDCFPGWRWLGFYQYLRYFSNGFDYKEVHEGRYESRVEGIKQSRCGNFVFVLLKNKSLKILKRDRDTGQYVELGSYDNVYDYNVSADGKTICVKYNYNRQQWTFSLKILRLNGSRFVEHPVTYKDVYSCKISKNGNTVCVRFDDNTLKILRWDGRRFVEHPVIDENVWSCECSSDGNTVCVEFRDYTLKILRWDGRRFVEHPVIGENVWICECSSDGNTVCVEFRDYTLKILRWDGRRFVEHSAIYEDVHRYKISSDGKMVCVRFIDFSLKILRWGGSEFVEHPVTYDNVYKCNISKDGKLICFSVTDNDFYLDAGVFPLKILIWNGGRVVESETYNHFNSYKISEDGNTVCVNFKDNSLRILRFDGSRFIEVGLYRNVENCEISADGKTVCVKFIGGFVFKILRLNGSRFVEVGSSVEVRRCMISADGKTVYIVFADGRFKILRKYPEVKNVEQAMFVYLAKKEQANGGLDLKRPDTTEQNTIGLLQILGSFDETTRSYLIEKYKIKVDPQNIKQAMFFKLATEKYDSAAQKGLDLTLSEGEEQNTTDLLETFRSMPQETQQGLVRDWKVKVPAAEIIMSELGLEQVEVGAESETDVEDAQEYTKSKLGRIGRRIMTQIVRCNCCAVPQEDS